MNQVCNIAFCSFHVTDGMNIAGIIAMSVTCGIILGKMREKGESLVNILIAVDQVTMNIISLIMW